jgi:thioredoxin-related protein
MTLSSRLSAIAVLSLALAFPSFATAGAGWSSDFEAARKEAATHDKSLLIDFTGSDWCSWCIKLRKEVFEQAGFTTAVADKFTLVELDYPRDKSVLSDKVVQQNEALLKQYPIKGYPTILLCDPAGKPFAATGYRPGGPAAYLPHLETLLAQRKKRDEGFSTAKDQSGVEKARTLIATLAALGLDDDMLRANYPEVAEAIVAADPADETGFRKKQQVEVRFAKFMSEMGEFRSKSDLEGLHKMVTATLEDPLVQGEIRQQVHGHHAGALASAGKKQEAIVVLKNAVAEDPKGPRTQELSDFIKILEREMAGLPPVPKDQASPE